MGTWNFSGDHNTPHKAVFCMWEDHDAYKEEMRQEYDEETLENMMGMDDQFGYSDWYDSEKEYYMEMLADDLKEAFGHKIDVDGKARDGQKVCTIEGGFYFAGIYFPFSVGIFLESGYYEGFALDWKITSLFDSEYYDELPDKPEDIIHHLTEWPCWNWHDSYRTPPGLAKMLAPKLLKRQQKELKQITDKLDKILMDLAPHNMEIGWCSSEYKEQPKTA